MKVRANLLAQAATPTTTHTPTITPTPTPTSAGRGDPFCDGWRNLWRGSPCFSFFWQSDEDPSSAPADLVDDGVINQEDLLALAGCWRADSDGRGNRRHGGYKIPLGSLGAHAPKRRWRRMDHEFHRGCQRGCGLVDRLD
ncbi:hypothetical protein HS125_18395 [bacterium]|nr:hypothetical protein [bacterium]